MLSLGQTYRSRRNQVSCDSRTAAFCSNKCWCLVTDNSGLQIVVVAKKRPEKSFWECRGALRDFYKSNVNITVQKHCVAWGGSKEAEASTILHELNLHLCFLKKLSSSLGLNQLPAGIWLPQFAQGSLHWLPWGVGWENAWCCCVHEMMHLAMWWWYLYSTYYIPWFVLSALHILFNYHNDLLR